MEFDLVGGSDACGKGGNCHFGRIVDLCREQCEKCWGFKEGREQCLVLGLGLGTVSGLGVHVLLHWKRDHLPACRLLWKDCLGNFAFCCGKCA